MRGGRDTLNLRSIVWCVEARRCGLISVRQQVGGGWAGQRRPWTTRTKAPDGLLEWAGDSGCYGRLGFPSAGLLGPPSPPPLPTPPFMASVSSLGVPALPSLVAALAASPQPLPGPGQMTRLPGHLALSWVTCAIPDPSPAGPSTLLWCSRPRRPIQTLEGFLVTSRPPPPCGVARGRCPGEEAPLSPPPAPSHARSRYTRPASLPVTDHGP